MQYIKHHIKTIPEIYTKNEISSLKQELSSLKVLEKFEYSSRKLQDLLPQLTVLDLSCNKLYIKELLDNIHEQNVDWISELDFRGNKEGGVNKHLIRSNFPFLEVLDGEIITEVGYGIKCKIKSIGGEWTENQEMEQVEEILIDQEKKEVLDYFENFEGELKNTKYKVDSMLDVFQEKMGKMDKNEDQKINKIINGKKEKFDGIIERSKEEIIKKTNSETSIVVFETW